MKRYYSLFFLAFCLASLYGQESLQNKIENLLDRSGLHSSVIGVSAYHVQQKKDLVHINEGSYFIPASSLKVITTFSLLDELGKDFQFKTKIGYTGNIEKDGTLKGNIWIIGSGDPSLGSPREEFGPSYDKIITSIAKKIISKGVNCVDGFIYVDKSVYKSSATPAGWTWSDVGNYYGAGAFGLNINENEYEVIFNRNAQVGALSSIAGTEPIIPGLTLRNEVIIEHAGSGDNAYIYGGEGFYDKIIKGSIPAGNGPFRIRGSIPDPPLFAAFLLHQKLSTMGIPTQGYDVSTFPSDQSFQDLHTIKSRSLKSLIKKANEKSINLYCESFLLKMASSEGTREKGIQLIRKKLSSMNIDTMDIIQVDGSGLNARNVITPETFTSFLTHFYLKWKGDALELLPRASYEGTVSGLLRNKKSKGQAWLKSGYIGRVLTYTGYIKTKSKGIIAISIMANNYMDKTSEIREISEKIIDIIYTSVD
jgi:D-alanyl-D-alanine carboxypeptidase/D-alanyl-D-alanine-endopeptidase (penicillin-binding protein 4)